MYSHSRIQIIGNIGQDPETRETTDGTRYVRVAVATHERWKDSEKRVQTRTDWHVVLFWGKLAEIASQHLTKGSYVSVDGTLRCREYKDKSGVSHRVWEIRATALGLLDRVEKTADPDPVGSVALPELARVAGVDEDSAF